MTSVIIIDFPDGNPHSNSYWQLIKIDDTKFYLSIEKDHALLRIYLNYDLPDYDYLQRQIYNLDEISREIIVRAQMLGNANVYMSLYDNYENYVKYNFYNYLEKSIEKCTINIVSNSQYNVKTTYEFLSEVNNDSLINYNPYNLIIFQNKVREYIYRPDGNLMKKASAEFSSLI